MKIGELSRRAGISTRLLRYYESRGLIEPDRAANGYRDYPEEAVAHIEQIRSLVASGLSTRIVRAIIPMLRGETLEEDPNGDLISLFAAELESLDIRIACLSYNRDAVRRYLDHARSSVPIAAGRSASSRPRA
jgi:DNA-binding transcriptional MerR regulator